MKIGGMALAICCEPMNQDLASGMRDPVLGFMLGKRISTQLVEDGTMIFVDGKEADKCPFCGAQFCSGD